MKRFTWECLDERACDNCLVSNYLTEHPETTDAQRKEMLECASSEIGWRGLPVEEVVAELRQDRNAGILSEEAVTVSVRGVRQWNEQHCRQLVRIQALQAQNNNIEGEF